MTANEDDAARVIADALTVEVGLTPEDVDRDEVMGTAVNLVAALRAAGLLPGPDDIVVSREALTTVLRELNLYGMTLRTTVVARRLRAALSQPHPEETP